MCKCAKWQFRWTCYISNEVQLLFYILSLLLFTNLIKFRAVWLRTVKTYLLCSMSGVFSILPQTLFSFVLAKSNFYVNTDQVCTCTSRKNIFGLLLVSINSMKYLSIVHIFESIDVHVFFFKSCQTKFIEIWLKTKLKRPMFWNIALCLSYSIHWSHANDESLAHLKAKTKPKCRSSPGPLLMSCKKNRIVAFFNM